MDEIFLHEFASISTIYRAMNMSWGVCLYVIQVAGFCIAETSLCCLARRYSCLSREVPPGLYRLPIAGLPPAKASVISSIC